MGEEHKNLAILFTDIVNSTEYFRKFGDEKGLEMLKTHVENCRPEIEKFEGVFLKTVGDSVMAYFHDPEDAIWAAISIQNRFEELRKKAKEEDRIHLRIGIHYGKVLFENEDIFGDTVNIASRLTDLSDVDGILISEAVKKAIPPISGLSFTEKECGLSLKAYSLSWKREKDYIEKRKLAVILKPVKRGSEGSYVNQMRSLVETMDIESYSDLEEFLVVIPKDGKKIYEFASQIISSIFRSIQDGKLDQVFKVAVNLYPDSYQDLPWSAMRPMVLYISEDAKSSIDEEIQGSGRTVCFGKRRFFEIGIPLKEVPEELILKLKLEIASRSNGFCFYCGDPRHGARDCPSKRFWDLSPGIERLRNLDSRRLNLLLLDYLLGFSTNEDFKDEGKLKKADDGLDLSGTIFNLKRVFQLGFLRKILLSGVKSWHDLSNSISYEEGGGPLFLALDSLRVSDYGSFHRVLREYEPKKGENFYILCLKGFYHVENEELTKAKDFFCSALKSPSNELQKIYALFLSSRISFLLREYDEAARFIREIFATLKDSKELRYFDFILSIYGSRDKFGERLKRRLLNLLREDPDFIMYMLFDPELFSFCTFIHETIKDLALETEKEIDGVLSDLKSMVQASQKFLLEEEAEDLRRRIGELERRRTGDAYFSFFDLRRAVRDLWEKINSLVKERKAEKNRVTVSLKSKAERYLKLINSFPYPFLVRKTKKDVVNLIKEIDDVLYIESYGTLRELKKKLEYEASRIERELERKITLAYFLKGTSSFLKAFLILFFSYLLIEVLLGETLVERMETLLGYEQKSLRVAGFMISFIASVLVSIRNVRRVRI